MIDRQTDTPHTYTHTQRLTLRSNGSATIAPLWSMIVTYCSLCSNITLLGISSGVFSRTAPCLWKILSKHSVMCICISTLSSDILPYKYMYICISILSSDILPYKYMYICISTLSSDILPYKYMYICISTLSSDKLP